MPKIKPIEGVPGWPPEEGTIGVVGVAPWATIDFLEAIYAQVKAEKDWHYPRVITDSNTKILSRGRFLDFGERDPSPFIVESIKELANLGASVVVPCNTAYILYDQWQYGSRVCVPSIIDATVAEISACKVSKIAVLASSAVTKFQLYYKGVQQAGLQTCNLTNQQQELVSSAIAQVKIDGQPHLHTFDKITKLFQQLSGQNVDGVILGCTELKHLKPICINFFQGVADSNHALAKVALRLANVNNIRTQIS